MSDLTNGGLRRAQASCEIADCVRARPTHPTVQANHLVHTIRFQLKACDIDMSWEGVQPIPNQQVDAMKNHWSGLERAFLKDPD